MVGGDYSDEEDLADLADLLSGVTLSGDAPIIESPAPPPISGPSSHSAPPPYSVRAAPQTPPWAPVSPPTTPRNQPRFKLYHFVTPEMEGYTTEWSEAAALTQGVHGARARLVTKKSKSRTNKGAYAVFHGREPGVYETWSSVKPLVIGVPGSIFQGYSNKAAAQAAFEYARSRSWTRRYTSRPSSPVLLGPLSAPSVRPATQPLSPQLPELPPYAAASNPLHGDAGRVDDATGKCLECSLNTLGLPGARFDSVYGRSNADRLYQAALARDEVHVVLHPY
ncbi:hypothetical protein B0H11DRAFT_2214109 [Mycena galericulata]|nr:hypothetical protein B0H11DRAFT_2214109 [Mycena galericulata]